jgi:hypothetical protein
MVHIDLNNLMPILLNALTTDPHLILDRGCALQIGGETGIDNCTHGCYSQTFGLQAAPK